MYRLILLPVLMLAASSSVAGPARIEKLAPPPTSELRLGSLQTLSLGRLANLFEVTIVPAPVIDELVRFQIGVRDLFHSATDRIASVSLSMAMAMEVPDLTILGVDPLPDALSKSSGYGWRSDPMNHDRRFHHGTDMRAKHGTPVVAAGDGLVTFCGRQGGYGNVIYVDHGGGVVTRYAHLQGIDTKKNAAITAGQKIGRVGSSGRATGPHLHFEVRIDGRDVNPITAMAVGELQRTQPDMGRIAAFALSPELQKTVISTEDRKAPSSDEPVRHAPTRVKRAQILW